MSVVSAARRLVQQPSSHPVVSVYLDLDPERFATPPARASQVRSVIDQAAREADQAENDFSHEERIALREDLERVREYLLSREPPFKGARALAVFCSSLDDLFEVLQISRPVDGRVVIERTPYVEPLVLSAPAGRWSVALVSRRDSRIFSGTPDGLSEQARIHEDVHGKHDQGGWSQANYQRSVEDDAMHHLRRVAETLLQAWEEQRFDRLAVGGPPEIVPRFESVLNEELRSRLAPGRVDVDVNTATDDQIRAVVNQLVEEEERTRERELLDRLAAGLATGGRAAGGVEATLEALNERRVDVLLLENGVDWRGGRCPSCGLLTADSHGSCPVDGTEIEEVEHLREATVESALVQDADVVVVRRDPDLGPHQGIAALLRF